MILIIQESFVEPKSSNTVHKKHLKTEKGVCCEVAHVLCSQWEPSRSARYRGPSWNGASFPGRLLLLEMHVRLPIRLFSFLIC